MPACAGVTESKRFRRFTKLSGMNSQKRKRMASLQSSYTKHRAFTSAKAYMSYFEHLEKHDTIVAGDFLRRHQ
jgi:hypothetical protein